MPTETFLISAPVLLLPVLCAVAFDLRSSLLFRLSYAIARLSVYFVGSAYQSGVFSVLMTSF